MAKITREQVFACSFELFKVLSLGVAVFAVLESLAPKSVTSSLNLSLWLVLWLLSAIMVLLIKSYD